MAATSPLPPNWTTLLEHIGQTLTQAVQLAQAREIALASENPPAFSAPADSLARFLESLERRGQEVRAPLAAFEQTLDNEQQHIRQHLATLTDLRQRLADWAGRAIG
jgi:hypothetical protein